MGNPAADPQDLPSQQDHTSQPGPSQQPQGPVLDFFNKRITDLKANKEIIMPKQAEARREAEILALKLELE